MAGFSPKCSILILAYNHEKFIAAALDGIIEQVVNFPYEIFVADDASTDRTQEIIRDYARRLPDRIKYRFNESNLGGKKNVLEGYTHLKGEYVTLLDGDDYWCDPSKLQKQIDFLDANAAFVGSAHNVRIVYDDPTKESVLLNKPETKATHTIIDLIDGTSYFHVSSLTFRNVFRGQLPVGMTDMAAGDWFLSMLYAEHGTIHYDPTVMSIYRIHQHGAWSGISPFQQQAKNLDAMYRYNKYLNYKYSAQFTRIWWAVQELEKSYSAEKPRLLTRLKYKFLKDSIDVTANPSRLRRALNRAMYEALDKRL